MQTQFYARPACRSGHRGSQQDLARLRALRFLHRDLSDLCAARRRARFPARPHLSHQGHAGKGPAGDRRRGQACRSLPLLPGLHDHLSVRGALHASCRPCARAYRGPPIAARSATGCLRALLAAVLPYPARFRVALVAGVLARPFAPLFAALGFKALAAMLRLSSRPPKPALPRQRVYAPAGKRKGRVALLPAAPIRCSALDQ